MLVVAILGDSRAVQMQTDDRQMRWVREILQEREREPPLLPPRRQCCFFHRVPGSTRKRLETNLDDWNDNRDLVCQQHRGPKKDLT